MIEGPQRIGRYQIRRELGRGMMGVVYEAEDVALARRVALKTFHLLLAPSPEEREVFEQRFLNEARVAAQLAHPNIVVVHDVGRDAETATLYMALEYLEGRTLAEVVQEGPLDWREALRITARLAEALHVAHAQGVIHRDIKPANIMLLSSGVPKIMDFGIAKVPASALTMAGQVFGTPANMSPEQALGQPLDARSDLFSLGSVLYQLLTGKRAFEGENVPRILFKVVHQDPELPSHLVPSVPPEADYVVMRSLAKAPASRYSDGRSLAEDSEDILAGRPPRHRATWTQPRPSDGTLISEQPGIPELTPDQPEPAQPALDLEAAFHTLVSGAPPEPEPAPPAVQPPEPSAAAQVPPAPAVPRAAEASPGFAQMAARKPAATHGAPPKQRLRRAVAVVVVAGAAVALAIVGVTGVTFLLLGREPSPAPPTAVAVAPTAEPPRISMPPEVRSPSPEGTEPSPASQAPEPPVPPATPLPNTSPPAASATARPEMPVAVKPARLQIDLEHSLKSGMLNVWLDGKPLVAEKLDSRVRKKLAGVVGVTLLVGAAQAAAIEPGTHKLRVQVSWDDHVKTEEITGTFLPDSARLLKIRLGWIRKNVSLEWE